MFHLVYLVHLVLVIKLNEYSVKPLFFHKIEMVFPYLFYHNNKAIKQSNPIQSNPIQSKMTTALIKKMKNLGFDRFELKELADTSRTDEYEVDKQMSREEAESRNFTKTRGVDEKKMKKYLTEIFGDDVKNPEKLVILPLMLRQRCHKNSNEFARTFGMGVCVGFNITACECGEFMNGELHSVVVDKNGKYLDITEDMLYEREKWFLPIHTFTNEEVNQDRQQITIKMIYRMTKSDHTGYFWTHKEHECGKNYRYVAPSLSGYKKKDVVGMIETYKNILGFKGVVLGATF